MFNQIFPSLWFFQSTGFGSNVFLLAGKKTVLIDSASSADAHDLKLSLAKIGFDCNQIDFVLHSHGHADHFGSDFLFPNAKIRMHKIDAERVNAQDAEFTASSMVPLREFPKINSFFKNGELIKFGSFELKVIFTPGHTAGSVCFFDSKNGLLFSGDTLFREGFGRFDLPSGNQKELLNSIKKISKLRFNFLLPGHGEILKASQKENILSAIQSLTQVFL